MQPHALKFKHAFRYIRSWVSTYIYIYIYIYIYKVNCTNVAIHLVIPSLVSQLIV